LWVVRGGGRTARKTNRKHNKKLVPKREKGVLWGVCGGGKKKTWPTTNGRGGDEKTQRKEKKKANTVGKHDKGFLGSN